MKTLYYPHIHLLRYLRIFILSLLYSISFSQNSDSIISIEKVYLHLDKPYYYAGEECWYKAYVINDLDLSPTSISGVLYVDLISPQGQVIKHMVLKIRDGGSAGDFTLDTSLVEGSYILRAYTQWMRNESPDFFYSITIPVFNPDHPAILEKSESPKPQIDLQFFPEGGRSIIGIASNTAFKAINETGHGVSIQGDIIDEENKVISKFNNLHLGMGVIAFTPAPGKKYFARLHTGEKYELPTAANSGYVLTTVNSNPNQIYARIQATPDLMNTKVNLTGRNNGRIYFNEWINLTKNQNDVFWSKKDLPEGIFQLTLSDDQGRPRCERLVFIQHQKKPVIQILLQDQTYSPRDSISFAISVEDMNGKNMETNLSISITDDEFISYESARSTIYTSLLLQSTLQGRIENPGWYFDHPDTKKLFALDLVLMTHGWSRYSWMNADSKPGLRNFLPEKSLLLEAQLLTPTYKPLINTQVSLLIPENQIEPFILTQSDSLGKISIDDIDIQDSTDTYWQVYTDKGKPRAAHLTWIKKQDSMLSTDSIHSWTLKSKEEKIISDEILKRYATVSMEERANSILLKEVVVEGKQTAKVSTIGHNRSVIRPSPDDLKVTTTQFLSRYAMGLPFAKPVRDADGQEIWVTLANASIVINIDGTVLEPMGQTSNPVLILNSIPMEDLDFVAVQGTNRHGYYIYIKTKGQGNKPNSRMIKLRVDGYYNSREFYHPQYGPTDNYSSLPDRRITLYWNPDFKTSDKLRVPLKFFNSDTAKNLTIVAEGIVNGHPVTLTKHIGKP